MLNALSSKKGVSPLIATILLIAFAVALGSVVMNWGFSLNLGEADERCSKVNLRLKEINEFKACYNGAGSEGNINFILYNTGTESVKGLTIWITGERDTKLVELDDLDIKKGVVFDKSDDEIKYDFTKHGKAQKIHIIPKVKINSILEVCPAKAVKAEKVGFCN
jgi:flagellin-like protein